MEKEAVCMPIAPRYAAPSPHKQQVSTQAAIEVIPLVLEPKSAFYTSPVLVLDFQSLYPSMVYAAGGGGGQQYKPINRCGLKYQAHLGSL